MLPLAPGADTASIIHRPQDTREWAARPRGWIGGNEGGVDVVTIGFGIVAVSSNPVSCTGSPVGM